MFGLSFAVPIPLPPYLFHVFAHGLPTLRRIGALDGFLELGSLFLSPRLTFTFGTVLGFLGVAVREGEFQQAAFHHRDVVDLFPEGVSVKFGKVHQASGNLHELQFPDALDAAVGSTATGASPVRMDL